MSQTPNNLQYIENGSFIHKLYPLVKLAWVFLVAIGLFFFHVPTSGAILFVTILAVTIFIARVPIRTVLSSSKLIFGIAFLLMVFHIFANPGEPVYQIGPLVVTDTGLVKGPVLFFRLSVIVLASFVFIWTTESRDLMIAFARAGINYRYAFAVFLALRFLPVIQREVAAVQDAHAIRGRATGSGLIHRFNLWRRYMFTVIVNGLRKAEATATALDCRAFGCYPHRTYVKDITYNPTSVLFPVIFVIIIIILVYLERTA
ncbi:MAG: energy-coupling factor transporter transmembrane component T [Anaerolineaceae bacterium]|jgi:energy-coupling factor transport system permease protein